MKLILSSMRRWLPLPRIIAGNRGKCDVPVTFSVQSISKPAGPEGCNKLFVGGLSYDTNETILKNAFAEHGEILEVKVICDHVTSKSKGYGFVQFISESEASMALQKMDGQLLDGRNIRVHYANKGRKESSNVKDE